ncbi:mucin, partial [Thraustotheca clavata]
SSESPPTTQSPTSIPDPTVSPVPSASPSTSSETPPTLIPTNFPITPTPIPPSSTPAPMVSTIDPSTNVPTPTSSDSLLPTTSPPALTDIPTTLTPTESPSALPPTSPPGPTTLPVIPPTTLPPSPTESPSPTPPTSTPFAPSSTDTPTTLPVDPSTDEPKSDSPTTEPPSTVSIPPTETPIPTDTPLTNTPVSTTSQVIQTNDTPTTANPNPSSPLPTTSDLSPIPTSFPGTTTPGPTEAPNPTTPSVPDTFTPTTTLSPSSPTPTPLTPIATTRTLSPVTEIPTTSPDPNAPTSSPVHTPSSLDPTNTPVPTANTIVPTTDSPVPTTDPATLTPSPTTPALTDIPLPTTSILSPTPTPATEVPVPTTSIIPTTPTPAPTDKNTTEPTTIPSTLTPNPSVVPTSSPSVITNTPTPSPTSPTPQPDSSPSPNPPLTTTPSPGLTPSSIPTEIPLIIPSTEPATLSPIINSLIMTNFTATPSPTNAIEYEQFLSVPTDAPTLQIVIALPPQGVEQLNKLAILGQTQVPVAGSGNLDAVPQNDHSDVLNRAKLDKDSAYTIAQLAAQSVIGTDSAWNGTIRYIVAVILSISLVLLCFFHFKAIDPKYITPDSYADAMWRPNSWELLLFVSTFQQLGALAFCKNNNKPQAVYIAFVDNLSWMLYFIREGGPSANSSNSTMSSTLLGTRRLSDESSAYDATGFIQFSLRADVPERDWFVRLCTTLLIAITLVVIVVIITAIWAYFAGKEAAQGYDTASSNAQSRYIQLRTLSHRCVGLIIVIAFTAIFPLVYVSTVELLQDATTSLSSSPFPHVNSIFSILTIFIVMGLLLCTLRWLMSAERTHAALSKWRVRIIFGVLYSNTQHEQRWFYGAWALLQVISAVIVAAVTMDGVTQLLALIVLHGGYILLVLWVHPFVSRFHLQATIVVESIVVLVYGICCCLNMALNVQTQLTLSYAVISIMILGIVLIWLRQLILLWKYASLYRSSRPAPKEPEPDDLSAALINLEESALTTSRGQTLRRKDGPTSHALAIL